MNRAYRLVWNDAHQTFVAVAETARGHGKRGRSTRVVLATGAALALTLTLLTLQNSYAQQAPPVAVASNALPVNGRIASGAATISQSGNTLNIQQATQKLVTNWDSFNIGSAAAVNFQQANASSVALNRVNSADPSYIFGSLTANGQVYLVNPSGIVFGAGSQVNVGGLVASSLALSDANFLAGNNQFGTLTNATANASAGAYASGTGYVSNAGTIRTASGGYVAFVAPRIENTGSISTPQGAVVLAAGDAVRLSFSGDQLIGYAITQGALNALIANSGAIQADDGLVVLSAKAADSLTRSVVNQSGIVEANSLTAKGGRVLLEGDDITLAAGSQTNATGATGGGAVLVGGDWQGGTWAGAVDLRHAITVTMAPGASIDVSATQNGDGGKAVLWSDTSNANSVTTAQGSITARGGANGGNGGQVETSGHSVDIDGFYVDTHAASDALGQTGLWLIDPYDYTISTPQANAISSGLASSDVTVTTSASVTGYGSSGNSSNAGNITVSSAISGANNLTLVAANNLNIYANLITTGSGKGITLKAGASINTSSGLTFQTNRGDLIFWSDTAGSGAGGVTIGNSDTFNTANGSTASGLSGGGRIVLAGGLDNGANGGTAGDGVPDGYAAGTSGSSYGVSLGASAMYSGGGNVIIRGTSSYGHGIFQGGNGTNWTVNSGTGSIVINGVGTASGANGAELAYNSTSASWLTMISAATSGTAISITGTSTHNYGVVFDNSAQKTLQATGGGNIAITGTAGGNYGIFLSNTSVLASTGSITLNGGSYGISTYGLSLGSLSGSGVTSSTSNITLTADVLTFNSGYTNPVNTSGTLTVQSASSSFSSALSWPLSGLTLSSNVSGLTLGASTNTANVTLASATSVAGPITVYGGTVTLNAGLTTTNTGTGDVSITATNLTGSGGVSLATGRTLSVSASGNSTYSGVIAGTSANLSASGGGNLTLTGANTYTGTTTIASGSTLTVGAGGTSGSLGTGVVTDNGALVFNRSNNVTVANVISGTGNLTQSGAGTVTLTGANTYTGATTVSAGTLDLGGTGSLGAGSYAGPISIASGATFDDSSSTAQTLSGVISGAGALTKDTSSSMLTLTGANTYTGATTVNAGTLAAGSASAFGNNSVTTVASGATLDLAGFSNTVGSLAGAGTVTDSSSTAVTLSTGGLNTSTTFGGVLQDGAGSLSLVKAGTGTFALSGANTYSGATAVNAGTLALVGSGVLGTGTTTVATGSTLQVGNGSTSGSLPTLGNVVLNGTLSFDQASGTTTTVSQTISGNGNLSQVGAGSTVVLSGANTYNGTTMVGAGTLTLIGSGALGAGTTTVVSGGTLQMGNGTTSGILPVAGGLVLNGNLVFDQANSTTTTVGQILGGSGNLSQIGAGSTVVLSGANTYSGTTTVGAGTLALVGSGALGAGTTTVATGATLQVGNGSTSGSLPTLGNVVLNGTLSFDQASGTTTTVSQTISGSGNLSQVGAGSTLVLSGANTYSGGTNLNAGVLNLGSSGAIGSSGSLSFAGGTLQYSANNTSDYSSRFSTAANQAYSIDTNGQSVVYAANLTSSGGSLTKLGLGTLSLTGSNTYSGGTTLSAGTLGVYSNSALGSGALTVSGSAALSLGRAVTSLGNNIALNAALAVSYDTNVNYLIVGGGGGGGSGYYENVAGGGGGAGGMLQGSISLASTSYSIAVGAGGAGAPVRDNAGSNGGSSTAFGLTAQGGGGGGSAWNSNNAGSGGSGGGGSSSPAPAGASGTSGQGNSGGAGYRQIATSQQNGGGGGGGAGSAGGNYNVSTGGGGTGGSGAVSSITGSATYYAGGGGGGGFSAGSGGTGGGGAGGGVYSSGANATYYGGGGGGGGSGSEGTASNSPTYHGGAGYQGIVIASYLGSAAGSGGTITAGTGTAAGYTLHTFTTTGVWTSLTLNTLATTFSGAISGTGALTSNASGGTLTFTGANTYSGSTTINSGTVVANNATALGTSAVTLANSSGALLQLASNLSVGSMAGGGTSGGNINLGAYSLTTGTDNTSTSYGGIVYGTGGLTKTGTGTQTLTGSNTYTGATTVSAGTLQAGATSAFGSNAVMTVSSGATLDLAGYAETLGSLAGAGTVTDSSSTAATLTTGGLNTSTTFSGVLQNGTGTLSLAKTGSGTLTLSGANTYTGTTTIASGGTLAIGAGSTNGSLGTGAVTDSGTLTFNRSDDVTVANAISGTGRVTKSGNNTLTLTANSSYSGATTISGGMLVLQNDAPTTGSSGFAGPGALTVQSAGTSFSSAFSTSGWSFGSTLTGLTLGASTNTANVTLANAINIAGPIAVYGGAVTLNAGLTASGTNTITLQGTGNVSESSSGYVSASNLLLSGGNVTLTNTSNAIGTLAASGVSGLSFVNNVALNIGTVGSTSGVSATGVVSIGTQSGNLTVAQSVTTTNATATALTLNAGISTVAGTATGGNLLISGSPTVSVGTGGTAKLYSGSVSGSTGLTALVGSGTGNFRYNSDESATHYTLALSTGLNAIYREQPTVTASIANQTMTYGDTTPTWTLALVSGGVNGDTAAQAFASAVTATVGGSRSSSNNYTAGAHTVSSSATATSQLGYAVSGSIGSGTLTVNQKALTYTGTASRAYDGTTTATMTNSASGIVTGSNAVQDAVTVTSTGGTFDTANAGTGKTVTVAGIAISGGADATNYSIVNTATLSNGTITPRTLTVSGLTASDKTYDGTTSATVTNWGSLSGLVGSETLTLSGTGANFASANVSRSGGVAQNQTVTATGLNLSNGSNGGLASNYQLSSTSAITSAKITPAALTVTANNDAKFVSLADNVGYNGVSYSGFVNGETSTTAGLTGTLAITRSNSSTHTAGTYSGVLVPTGLSANNYAISYVNGDYTIVPAGQLLVQAGNVSTTYGTAASYTVTASYLDSTSNVVHTLSNVTYNGGGNFTVSDGAGASATFTLQPTVGGANASTSTSGQVVVGAYQLAATGVTTQNAINFNSTLTVVGAETVTQKLLSASASGVSKVYDGTTNVNGASLGLSGVLTNDLATLSGSGAFASANAGTNVGYSFSNLALSGADAGNYYLQGRSFSGSNGVITPKTVTLSASKTYDGTTALTGNSVTIGGLIGTETLSFSGAAAYDAHVATSGNYINALTLANGSNGGLASNYQLPTLNSSNAPVTITPQALTDTAMIVGTLSKGYDGTTSVSGATASISNTFVGGVAGDTFTLTGLTLAYDNAHVANASSIAASGTAGLSIVSTSSNSALSDYSFTVPTVAAVAASITPATLAASLSNTGVTKVYDGTSSAPSGFTPTYSITGLAAGDTAATLSNTGAAYNSQNVLTANQIIVSGLALTGVTGSNGSALSDYTLTTPSASGSAGITPKTVSLSASKTYDGTTDLAGSFSVGGLIGSETLNYSGATASDAHVATSGKYIHAIALVNGSNGELASNYQLPTLNASNAPVTILPATLTASLSNSGVTKVYDGTTSAPSGFTPTYSFTGLVAGDTAATLSNTGAAYNSQNVLAANQVTVSGLALTGVTGSNGSGASDYTFTTPSVSGNASITPKTVGVTGLVAADKTYDGTTTVAISNWGSVSGAVGSETLMLNPGTASFANANAGAGQTVTASGYTLANGTNGGLASNYQLSGGATTTATIQQAPLTVTANNDAKFVTLADNAGYNGVSYSGFVNGESSSTAGLTGTLAITRSNSGNDNAGTYNGVLVASGLSASNYNINYVNGNYTIVPAGQLLVQVSNTSTTYGTAAAYSITSASYFDGSTVHQLSGVTSNSNGSFTVSDGVGASATFNLQASNATNSSSGQLAVGAYQLGAANATTQNAQNFTNTLTVVGAETVTQKAVTVSAGSPTKVYDGTTGMSGTSLSGSGVLSGDVVTVSGNGQYASRNAGTNIGYSFSNLTLAGADAGDYYISGGNAISGNNGTITPKTLTLTALTDTKTYDGTTLSSVAPQASGLVAGDTIAGLLQSFDSSAVGTRTLDVSGYTIGDGNGGNNYAVTLVAAAGKINSAFTYVPPTTPPNGNAANGGGGTTTIDNPNGGSGHSTNGTPMADNGTNGGGNSDGGSGGNTINGNTTTADNTNGASSSSSNSAATGSAGAGAFADMQVAQADMGGAAGQANGGAAAGTGISSAGTHDAVTAASYLGVVTVVVVRGGKASMENSFDVVEEDGEIKAKARADRGSASNLQTAGKTVSNFFFTMSGVESRQLKFAATLTDRGVVVTVNSEDGYRVVDQRRNQLVSAVLGGARSQFNVPLDKITSLFLKLD